mmetsp:Transcript_14759/g.46320  ORF Transcript_14759/g.46320 Transcript_14759/m.46320 type:complete len:220 (-) Transcript_14759:81-740(-)
MATLAPRVLPDLRAVPDRRAVLVPSVPLALPVTVASCRDPRVPRAPLANSVSTRATRRNLQPSLRRTSGLSATPLTGTPVPATFSALPAPPPTPWCPSAATVATTTKTPTDSPLRAPKAFTTLTLPSSRPSRSTSRPSCFLSTSLIAVTATSALATILSTTTATSTTTTTTVASTFGALCPATTLHRTGSGRPSGTVSSRSARTPSGARAALVRSTLLR